MQTVAEKLASYAVDLKYEDLPADVVQRTKSTIVDTLGCMLGGYSGEPAKIARDLAGMISSKQPATVLCGGMKTSLDYAVFANGVMLRYLDFNDGYTGAVAGHPSDVIAALLSTAEVAGADGRDLILATVLSYEVFCRMSDTADINATGWDHVTFGGMASLVGVAKLLKLTREQTVQAVNLMVAPNNPLFQTRIGNVSMWKGCAFANASRNAVFAAQLAARGMTGPSPVFEGKAGFFHAVSRGPFELAPFGGGGHSFKIMECSTKGYPLGQYSQSIVQAALEARDRIGDSKNIAEVSICTLQSALKFMADSPDKWKPLNRETADHSIPYSTAVAMMYGEVHHKHFSAPYLQNAELLDLVSRVKCAASEEANKREPEAMICELDVVTRAGKRESVRVEYHRGHWRNPMSTAEMGRKFLPLSREVLPAGRGEALLEKLWKLETLGNVAEIIELTRV